MFNELAQTSMLEKFRQTWTKFPKDVWQFAEKAKLLETRLNNTNAAENSQKASQHYANKVFKTDNILYDKDAQDMVQDQLELERKKEKKIEETWEKKYKLALQKCYK